MKSDLRRCLLVVVGGAIGAAILIGAGCDDVSVNVNRAQSRAVRPAARPITPASRPTGPERECETACEPPRGAELCYHQVLLLSEAAPADPPAGLRCVPLARAQAEDVGRTIAWLYPPSGPAGGRTRYCMVYPSAKEADAAARMAVELDVTPAGGAESRPAQADTAEPWQVGVGLLYGGASTGFAPSRVRRAESALARALGDHGLPAIRRWAAGMLAGRIVGGHLGDYAAADRYFAAAGGQAGPGSLEQMATLLAQAGNHIQNGEPQAARQLLGQVLAGFEGLRDTEVFERAGRALRELDRVR